MPHRTVEKTAAHTSILQIVRFLSQGEGKLVWSSPDVQTKMGAKDALCKIANMGCGLVDTFAYYDAESLASHFKKTAAFQPRVIKQNRGSAGEGIWLVWMLTQDGKKVVAKATAGEGEVAYDKATVYTHAQKGAPYCAGFGDASLNDEDMLKLMEMNDNHVEYHTVGEFLAFCVDGPKAPAALASGMTVAWTSSFPGEYLKGGKEAGGQLVDQRLLPRIEEGEVRVLMTGSKCQMAVHKKPDGGGLSAVGGNSVYTYYTPEDPIYKGLLQKLYDDLEGKNAEKIKLLDVLELAGEPLPLLWTADYIPKDNKDSEGGAKTEYVVGEFN
jgi:hypothetical protein